MPTPKQRPFPLLSSLSFALATLFASQVNATEIRPATVLFKVLEGQAPNHLKAFNALLHSQGLVTERTLEGTGITIATFAHTGREIAIANLLKHSGYVEFAEPDYAIAPTLQPNDSNYANQWHHQTVNSPQAWETTTGNHNVLVGVCDTGFDVNHPDLAGNLRTDLAYNAQDGSNYIFDANGHGTGTAGTLGAVGNNSTGVAGINWDVDIIPIRIAISDNNSSAYISTMANCIEYAADQGARIVNLSYGGIQYETINAAAQYLRDRNGLLFMSAGNDGQEFADYPDFTSFVGVGATDQNNNRASFSSWGNYVDVTAPGVSILTTYPNNRYVNYSGTSFSAPLTAGVAALMVAANPTITPEQIEQGLFSTATDIGDEGEDNVFGHGLVNAAAAVNYAANIGHVSPPEAKITANQTSLPFGNAFAFDARNSLDSDGMIVSYQWSLGDGTTSSLDHFNHTYDAAGVYQVTLTVTDNDGLSDSSSIMVQVTNEAPVAEISVDSQSGSVPLTVNFNAQNSFDNDGEIIDYAWNFGDGNSDTGSSTSHTYTGVGEFTAILTVTDNAGAQSNTSVLIRVQGEETINISAPSSLRASVRRSRVSLSWRDNSKNEDGFYLHRYDASSGELLQTTTLDANTTRYNDYPENGNYLYQVQAFQGNNLSEQSNAVSANVR
ncbi:hypothetical protein THMIRHAS_23380 [Thiosulfatimonas sediminis]|uniref:PKD domain-containing protein n=1 Tax=Thiosulfatimonas sediminis TaxID=2675054 RepID=A0A6F8PXV5_9GAMM|nr:S8 family serine peptidase [Thiosulfatimonas sediminis]BBP46965.1 hypothetical protein THMIRHAS_23380 [Thiosulfatimonas sediminis]